MINAFRLWLDEWVLDDPDRGIAVLSGSFAFESCGKQGLDGAHGCRTALTYVDEHEAFGQNFGADLLLQVSHD
jgi:hypothetical protein